MQEECKLGQYHKVLIFGVENCWTKLACLCLVSQMVVWHRAVGDCDTGWLAVPRNDESGVIPPAKARLQDGTARQLQSSHVRMAYKAVVDKYAVSY